MSAALLSGRRALITGGAGRLATAIAAAYRREGALVVLSDIDPDRGRYEVAVSPPDDEANAVAGAVYPAIIPGDMSEPDDIARVIREAEALVGPLDTLVTCAAVSPNVPIVEMHGAYWDRVFAVNVRGPMLLTQALARLWTQRGTPGSVVHLSSGAARSARRGAAAYCASKAALDMLVHVSALELGPHGIRVNAVAPGLVMDEVVSADAPLGRTGAPNEIAEAAVFLASDRSAWTTGAILEVTGGSHCGRAHLDFTRDLGGEGTP